MSHTLILLQLNVTFTDVQMMPLCRFDISTGFRSPKKTKQTQKPPYPVLESSVIYSIPYSNSNELNIISEVVMVVELHILPFILKLQIYYRSIIPNCNQKYNQQLNYQKPISEILLT